MSVGLEVVLFVLLSLCMCMLDLLTHAVCHPCGSKADSEYGASTSAHADRLLMCPARLHDFTASLRERQCGRLGSRSEAPTSAPVITYNYPASHCGGGDRVDTLYAHERKANRTQTAPT